MQGCPCGTRKLYDDCCSRFITGYKIAETPEELMRSRFTAYTENNVDYIFSTMKPPALNDFDVESVRKWLVDVVWLRLDVIKTSINHSKGHVEFIAFYTKEGKGDIIHEISEFHKINGAWYYVDGKAKQPKPYLKSQS